MSECWVFIEELAGSCSVTLAPDEARHLVARRLRVGDPLVVFDGLGHTAPARIESLGKPSTRVRVDAIVEVARPDSTFVLASAIPKGDRLSTMLQMLSQLGLVCWQPLVLQDSAVRKLDPTSSRLIRILIESCKVSRRAWRLEVRAPCSLEDALAKRSSAESVYFGDRNGPAVGFDRAAGLAVIGPEAGFSDSERRILQGVGALPRSFGAHNLRIETAAVAATVALHLNRAAESAGEERK